MNRTWVRASIGALLCVIGTGAIADDHALPQTDGEALIFDVLFERCRTSVYEQSAPYGTFERAEIIGVDVNLIHNYSPVNFEHHLVEDRRMVATYGSVPNAEGGHRQLCQVSMLRSFRPTVEGIEVGPDFMSRLHARAEAEGFEGMHGITGDASMLEHYVWRSLSDQDLAFGVIGNVEDGVPLIFVITMSRRLP